MSGSTESTPPSPSQSEGQDSFARLMSTDDYHSGLVGARKCVVDDVYVASVSPVQTMCSAVLRETSQANLTAVRSELVRRGELLPGQGWKGFLHPSGPETTWFKPMRDIYLSITSAAVKCGIDGASQVASSLAVNGHKSPKSERTNTAKPDAYIVVNSTPGVEDQFKDICFLFEFKKADNPNGFRDDFGKLLWNMGHKLRSDPRCRFVGGMTIESHTARLWHCDRSTVAMSEPFNFMKDPDTLLKIFLAIICSSEDELGFDPTIRPAPGSPGQYDIDVHVAGGTIKTFRTVTVVADFAADRVRSRGTRVWSVYDPANPDNHLALKDCWADSSRPLEGDTLNTIHRLLKEQGLADKSKHFLECLCQGIVLLSGRQDDTDFIHRHQAVGQDEYPLSTEYALFVKGTSAKSGSSTTRSTGDTPSTFEGESSQHNVKVAGRKGINRVHYRLVLSHLGVPLHNLDTHHDVFLALKGGLNAIEAMWKVGYIHRDLSGGNVLLVQRSPDEESVGVLIDMEYAKRFSEERSSTDSTHDVRTGTKLFMAAEVEQENWLFLPQPTISDIFSTHESSHLTNRPWFHNVIHDIESVWRIGVWSTYHLPNFERLSKSDRGYFHKVFGSHRATVMLSAVFFEQYDRPPDPTWMKKWRTALQASYAKQENNLFSLPPKESAAKNRVVYDTIISASLECVDKILLGLERK